MNISSISRLLALWLLVLHVPAAEDHRIASAAFSPDGSLLAVGGYRVVTLLDPKTGRILARLPGHPATVTAVQFSPDGRWLAAAGGLPGRTGEVRLWDVSFIKPQGLWAVKQTPILLQGASDVLYGLAWSRDGRRLAAASYDHDVYLWKLVGGGPQTTDRRPQTTPKRVVRGRWSAASGHGPSSVVRGPFAPSPLHPLTPSVLHDHTDSVYSVAFNPQGTLLASAGRDRTVKIWDPTTGKRLYTLSEATAEVYAVAFSPDGSHLATGGVDKTLRVYAVSRKEGKLHKSAFAHDGAVLRILCTRDGAGIYTAGEDRAVKRWDAATLEERKVYPRQPDWPQALALSPNGQVLAVGRNDGSLALYDAATGRLIREPLHGPQPQRAAKEPPTTSAIPGRRLGDRRQRRPVANGPVTLAPASLNAVSPTGAVRGGTTRLTLTGGLISDATGVYFDDPGISGKIVTPPDSNSGVLRVDSAIGPQVRVGIHRVFLQTPHGSTGSVTFAVGAWPEAAEQEPNDTADRAQKLAPPCTVVGAIGQAGDVDCYAVDAREGEELVFQIVAQPVRSRLQPVLALLDASGKTVAESEDRPGRSDALLGYHFPAAGTYVLQVRDYEGAGGPDRYYRLNIGEFPVVTRVFPLGVQQGTTNQVRVEGFNIGDFQSVPVSAPAGASWGQTMELPLHPASGPLLFPVPLAVGQDPELLQQPGNNTLATAQRIPVPSTVNGVLAGRQEFGGPKSEVRSPEAVLATHDSRLTTAKSPLHPFTPSPPQHFFRFPARKGVPLVLEVMARRLGSPLDSQIEVLDSDGKQVEQAVLRAVGRTEVTLADRDSSSPGLRLVSWDDFHIGDYVLVGREVIRILELPKGPDDDMQFRSLRGQRLGYFGTTPEYHSVGAPVYKVEVHPPGSRFSPNGYPLTRLTYENDDGGPLYGKDSYLLFTPPADGEYVVRLTDARGQQGEDYAYRLMIHPPRPDFRVAMNPEHPNVPKGGAVTVDVSCDRFDGFDGEIEVSLEGLPPGFTATRTTIQAGETSASLLLSAVEEPDGGRKTEDGRNPNPSPVIGPPSFRLVARARIGDREVLRTVEPQAGAQSVTVLPEPDVRVSTNVRELVIHPGGEAEVEAHVDRQHGFGSRVPLDVKNLPFGVRVMNVGLNGILVTEEQDARTYTLYCEPWVKPQTRPFYTVGNVEGGMPNAAPALLLRVEPAHPVKESNRQRSTLAGTHAEMRK